MKMEGDMNQASEAKLTSRKNLKTLASVLLPFRCILPPAERICWSKLTPRSSPRTEKLDTCAPNGWMDVEDLISPSLSALLTSHLHVYSSCHSILPIERMNKSG